MKKLHIFGMLFLSAMLIACTKNPREAAAQTESTVVQPVNMVVETEETQKTAMQIRVQGNGHTVIFELNNSAAAKSLYDQLPLTIQVEDYSSNEKIFYPPAKLETFDTPLTAGGGKGGLAYFASWGDVIMYYGSYGPYSGLYDLGTAISGGEWIEELSGEILIEQADAPL